MTCAFPGRCARAHAASLAARHRPQAPARALAALARIRGRPAACRAPRRAHCTPLTTPRAAHRARRPGRHAARGLRRSALRQNQRVVGRRTGSSANCTREKRPRASCLFIAGEARPGRIHGGGLCDARRAPHAARPASLLTRRRWARQSFFLHTGPSAIVLKETPLRHQSARYHRRPAANRSRGACRRRASVIEGASD